MNATLMAAGDTFRRGVGGRRVGRDRASARPAAVRFRYGLAAYQVDDDFAYRDPMTTRIAMRLDDLELAALDAEVRAGRAANRSDAVRRGIARLQRDQRYRSDEATLIELARRGEPVYPDLHGLLDLPHPALD